MSRLTHLRDGKAKMVDVGAKPSTRREAIAYGLVRMSRATAALLGAGGSPKGDVFGTARLAGILAAKKTDELIPLCHSLGLESIEVGFQLSRDQVLIRAIARAEGKTGVEMEALTAVSVAGLTIYDMCKSADRGMTLGPVFLARKSGGRSGVYQRSPLPAAPDKALPWL